MQPRAFINYEKAEICTALLVIGMLSLHGTTDKEINLKMKIVGFLTRSFTYLSLYEMLRFTRSMFFITFNSRDQVNPAPAVQLEAKEDYAARLKATGWQGVIPSHLTDIHITNELMNNPVLCRVDARTYERSAMMNWWHRNGTSPHNRQPFSEADLIQMLDLKDEIQKFVEEREKEAKELAKPVVSNAQKFKAACEDLFVKPIVNRKFICSLTNEMMTDPVTASDGRHYERTALEAYVKTQGKRVRNKDGIPLRFRDAEKRLYFLPNPELKKQIEGELTLLMNQAVNRQRRDEEKKGEPQQQPQQRAAM